DANMLTSPACKLVLPLCANLLTRKDDAPAARTVDTGQHIKQSRFTAARWPNNSKDAPHRNTEADIIENSNFLRWRLNNMCKMFYLYQSRFSRSARPLRMIKCSLLH